MNISTSRLCCLLTVLLAAGTQMFAQTASGEVAATASIHDAFQLTSSTAVTRPIVVDSTEAMTVRLLAASQTLTVTLLAPGGVSYTIGTPATPTFTSEISPINATKSKPGASYLANITQPLRGTWTLSVRESVALAAPLDVLVTVFLNNSTRMVLAGGGEDFPAANPIRLAAVAFDGTAKLSGLAITGRLFRPFDPAFPPVSVAFHDDGANGDEVGGDRIYEALITPAQPGQYQVQIDAAGVASTGAFRRTAATAFRVVPRNAQIIDFIDDGFDDDFDGLIDRIDISPAATIAVAGSYAVSVRLRGSNGREMLRTIQSAFDSGIAFADVYFPATDVARELAIDGPYDVVEIRYLQLVDGDLVAADVRYDLGSTAAYQLETLQHPRLRLSGSGSAEGIDLNGNGKFDALSIELEVIADFAGEYTGSVSLTDVSGREIAFASGTVVFDSGPNTLLIVFDGSSIGAHAVNGPYFLSNLILYGEGESLVVSTAFVTPSFAASQFEGFPETRRRSVRH